VLSALLSYAVEEGRLSANPCFGISNLYSSNRAEIIWRPEDVARVEQKASPEVTRALKLACLTGLRRGDLLRLSWSHVGEHSIEIATGKSRHRKTAVIPLYSELRDLLNEIPKRSPVILTNTEGKPWKTGFGSTWTKTMASVGEKALHFHDARGTFATRAYLADFSVREVAEMLTWSEDKVERIINRYVKKNALLRDRIRRMDEAAGNAK
jgi:integrase